jgi:AcrR family transcriptional regulator
VTEYASRGDPERTMALLWGRAPAPTRGPKQSLDLDDVVATAVEVADSEGLAGVSMRKVAERLGRSAMSLYTYVPGKAELLDLMIDRALGELPTRYDLTAGWRPAVEELAHNTWALYERHPWLLQVAGSRAVLGPHELDTFEAQLAILDGLGLSGVDMNRIVASVSGFVRGAARGIVEAKTAEQATGQSDDDWWNARSPLLDELSADVWPDRYPVITRLQEHQAFDQPDRTPNDATPYMVKEAVDAFEFGLQRLLDGLEAYITRRARRATR